MRRVRSLLSNRGQSGVPSVGLFRWTRHTGTGYGLHTYNTMDGPPPPPPTSSSESPRPVEGQSSLYHASSASASAATSTPAATEESSHPPVAPAASNREAALVNAASSHLNSQLPPLDTRDSTLPVHPFRAHIRTPTAAGLQLQTDLNFDTPPAESRAADSTSTLEEHTSELHHSASVPVVLQDSYLRSTLSAGSMTGSLSPGSALSSPALNALSDLTPLPSPLIMNDSPWARTGANIRPRSRGASNASSRDDAFGLFARGTLSPSPSLKKKGYERLKTAARESTMHGTTSDAGRDSKRSVSEAIPEAAHNNIRSRHVTISNVAPEQIEANVHPEPQLQREAYLAATRGLVSARVASGLPTPPASNASNKSVTESESEDVADEDKIEYLTVRQGAQKSKKLFRPVRKLGQGTFSKVYLATSEKRPAKDPLDEATLDPQKLVAIKVVEHGPAGGADEERVELSLKREVEMLRSVSHPSLVHLKAFDNGDTRALLVLSYCPGGDLFEVASAHADILTVNVVQRIFAELVSGVHYLHENLIVHRDIKLESTSSLCLSSCLV